MFKSKTCLRRIINPLFPQHVLVACIASSSVQGFTVGAGGHDGRVSQFQRRLFSRVTSTCVKTKTSIQVDDLPQGAIPLDPVPLDKDAPTYPTVVLQARTNMRKFENCVLLTRVGGFYELYFEHAEEYGPLLNLKVGRKKTNAGSVPMSGFPFFQLDRFLKILVKDLNCYVAIAEEFPNDASAKVKAGGLLHDRKVSRIVTPGTLIDESFVDPFTNNYILAIHMERTALSEDLQRPSENDSAAFNAGLLGSAPVGLAWLDLSTGQFFTQSIKFSMLPSAVARIGPSEIVLDEGSRATPAHAMLFSSLNEDKYRFTYCRPSTKIPITDWNVMLETDVLPELALEFTSDEIIAGSVLLHYVKTRLQGVGVKLQLPVRYQAMETMGIDRNSMRALEIKETMRDNLFKGSLLHAIRRTVTKGGARLLNDWLSSPSSSLKLINSRLDLVTCMLTNGSLHEEVVSLLRRCHDSQRLVQKFSLGRGDPDDLLLLANTIAATEELVSMLRGAQAIGDASPNIKNAECLLPMIARVQLDGPLALARRVRDAIDEEGLVQQHQIEDSEAGEMVALAREIASSEGTSEDVAASRGGPKKKTMSLRQQYVDGGDTWIMKPAASSTLRRLHRDFEQLTKETSVLSEDLRTQLGASTLTLRWTPGLGHICHVKGKDTRILANTRSVSSSRSTRSFHHPQWTQLGQKIDQARFRIRAEEQQIFLQFREQVIFNLVKLRHNAAVLDELDIACSFATLAQEQSLVRPILKNNSIHKIIGGRHPTVQGGLQEQGRSFVTNNCFVGDQEPMWLITGPNMGGKSTFLRQNALITVMAQVGSYVPAEYAEIGIVDQVFSRVGSADNLYLDQSTFMVEMLETATILKNATPRSFVIMDEIGRGTTPDDGVAIAFAVLHHLYYINQCRTLFATHFHTLADLSKDMARVGCYCTDIAEDESGGFSYVHKLRKGVNRESHALKVATLAGLPDSAIGVASGVLKRNRPG